MIVLSSFIAFFLHQRQELAVVNRANSEGRGQGVNPHDALRYLLEFSFYGATHRTLVRHCILTDIATDLAYVIYGLTINEHVIHGLFVKLSMTVLNITGLGKGLCPE